MDTPLKSVTHGQCDARPMVTFPGAGHHRPLTGTKLYCFVTEARVCVRARACACVCEQLAQGCDLKADRTADIRTRDLFSCKFNAQTATPPGHRGKCPGERVPHSIKDASVVPTGADSVGRTDRSGRDGAKDASRNKDCRRL